MEYRFQWQTIESDGQLSGRFEQTIYGETVQDALAYFTSFHGDVGPDQHGCTLEITSIKQESNK